MPPTILRLAPNNRTKNSYSSEELHELEEIVKARRENPRLVPSMFLWKDFGESAGVLGTCLTLVQAACTSFINCFVVLLPLFCVTREGHE